MRVLELITKFFGTKSVNANEDMIVCANCWGKQEYGGEVREYFDDQTKANICKVKERRKAFVAQFVETHVTGIELRINR